MGERDQDLGEVLSIRVKRRWFLYLAVGVFYSLDIYLTLLIRGSSPVEESNPVSRYVLETSGPDGWVFFRLVVLLATTSALLVAFALATVKLGPAEQERGIDRVEEVALGSVVLFYAIALVHNLMSISVPLPRFT